LSKKTAQIKRKVLPQLWLFWKTSTGLKVFVYSTVALLFGALLVFLIEHGSNQGFGSFFDSVWWMLVTISTIGYGDRYPITTWGRIVAIFIIFSGMGIMAVITGRFATFLMERQMKEENGLLDYAGLKGHFIICGWRGEMNQILYEILDSNADLNPADIVMLNRAGKESLDGVRGDIRLKGLKYVHGDFIEERELIRAGVRGAKRVLILADSLAEGDLQQVDSKTVMAVMSIKNLNKTAYVCAELLDNKFEKYLKLSHCDEIMLSRDFIRAMLVSAVSGTGVSHVIASLLQGERGAGITTLPVPLGLVAKTYADLCRHFAGDRGTQLIGLLENTGNILTRKQEALREVQKNPDIAAVVPDLRSVKSLTANDPVINPPPEYTIKRFSRAIVLRSTASVAEGGAV
jgi:voltage-gated potassium channel